MIIATIGSYSYKLEKHEDAEKLLEVFGVAVPVETSHWLDGDQYFEEDKKKSMGNLVLRIVPGELLDSEEAKKLIAKAEEGHKARRAKG